MTYTQKEWNKICKNFAERLKEEDPKYEDFKDFTDYGVVVSEDKIAERLESFKKTIIKTDCNFTSNSSGDTMIETDPECGIITIYKRVKMFKMEDYE